MCPDAGSSLGDVHRRFEHAVIVGGTGMLAEATRFIRAWSNRMTVVQHQTNAAQLNLLPDDVCRADWSDSTAFSAMLSPRISAVPPDLALLWVHSNGQTSLLWLLRQLAMRPVLVVHVLGSSSGAPPESRCEHRLDRQHGAPDALRDRCAGLQVTRKRPAAMAYQLGDQPGRNRRNTERPQCCRWRSRLDSLGKHLPRIGHDLSHDNHLPAEPIDAVDEWRCGESRSGHLLRTRRIIFLVGAHLGGNRMTQQSPNNDPHLFHSLGGPRAAMACQAHRLEIEMPDRQVIERILEYS